MTENTITEAGFVLAHISDPHFACVEQIQMRDLFTKRLFGSLRWKLKRQAEHNTEILTILGSDLQRAKPDHTVITGDLTQLGLPVEFEMARKWLDTLGTAKTVTIVPGNHDMYIETDWHGTFEHWLEFMTADKEERSFTSITSIHDVFPTLRIRDQIALIGINTAYPSSLHLATGEIGDNQLNKLKEILKQLSDRDLFRVLLIHHPPVAGIVSWRKSLIDMLPLQEVLCEYGVDLVLFGHTHKSLYERVDTASGSVPVIGAPSASSLSSESSRRARYFLYTITSAAAGWKLQVHERIFSLEQWCFVDGLQQEFSFPARQRELVR